jgi:hypothetical protein
MIVTHSYCSILGHKVTAKHIMRKEEEEHIVTYPR